MVTEISMQIVGAICIIIGIRMNLDPVGFNESIFKKIDKKSVNQLAALRLPIGGSIMAVGIIHLYCSFMVTSVDAMKSILLATAIGLIVLMATVISGKIRGFSEEIPPLPIVTLSVLTAICLYASLF